MTPAGPQRRPEPPKLAVALLGPFSVTLDGAPVELTTGRLRAMLATLAMSAGEMVSLGRLAESVWGKRLPANARRSIQTYVARLRHVMGAESIRTCPDGYLLDVDPDQVDALRMPHLLDCAAAADPAAERGLLVQALALWRGRPFEGVPSEWLERAETPRLVERYVCALERRIDLDLAGGDLEDCAALAAELGDLTARFPIRESLWVRRLLLLDRSGRRAEALYGYEMVRGHLADELGVEPGIELQRVYADLLAERTAEPASDAPVTDAAPPGPLVVTPRQLPPDLDCFAGREAALRMLDALVGDADPPGAALILGTAGVGKTTLAVHWAHRIANRFPDGQLYLDLRGIDGHGPGLRPAEAVRTMLDSLQVGPERIPTDAAARTGLYRSLLAGRRMLIVLDNALDTAQVRPLLPGAAGCLVVITSRHLLTGLVAVDNARPVSLDLLPVTEARQLIARRIGERRVAAEPAAIDEIVGRCSGLPLALAVVAARAAIRPEFPLHVLARALHEAGNLDVLAAADPTGDVRTVLSWSYLALSGPAAHLFRLLALHPGTELGPAAAASLAGVDLARARTLLTELTTAHVLAEPTPDRYGYHDLLRAYAAELLERDDPRPRQAAGGRLVDHYMHSACRAAMLLNPHRDPIDLPQPLPGVTVVELADLGAALAWFTAEAPVLRALTRQAEDDGDDALAWRLAWTATTYYFRQGHWTDWAASQRIALAAAERLGAVAEQALSHRELGRAYARLRRFTQAHHHLQNALRLSGQLADATAQAHIHVNISSVLEQQGRYQEALGAAKQALDLFRSVGHRVGQARAANNVGWYHALLGEHRLALVYCGRALALHRALGDRPGQAATWDSLGYAHHRLGEHDRALHCYGQAVALYRDVADRYNEADVLVHLGDADDAVCDVEAARAAWKAAARILTALNHPDVEQVRARLNAERSTS